jgi:hypothetical protein
VKRAEVRGFKRKIKNKIKKLSFWNFFVDKRFIFFFEKDSRRGPARGE